MTIRKFTIISEVVRVAAPGDLLFRTIGNFSTFPHLTIAGEVPLTFPRIVNNSVFPGLQITSGDDFNLLFPVLTNSSTFPSLTIQESPPDGELLLPTLTNSSTFPGLTIQESPPDGSLRFLTLTNISTLGALVVNEDEPDDDDGSIGGSPDGDSSI